MAELAPPVFLRGSEGAISTFDYSELASGNAIEEFFLVLSTDSGGTDYIITENAYGGTPISIDQTGVTSSNTTYTFTGSTFLFSRTVEGNMRMGFSHQCLGTPGAIRTSIVEVKVYRTRDGTDTQMGSTLTTATLTAAGGAAADDHVFMNTDVTKTRFKKGDNLKVEVKWTWTVASGVADFSLYFDPFDATSGVIEDTKFSIFLPFRIDL